ncbi:unnamed protein product [Phytophthora fragariaefolia]|uniref:Unnamed protein product n=1 Tax=Phytophthora fragariaefolia TaxID=1490495 RepID=A0A9W6TM64_9STRA|nr:unnamed protein product [Phytophthora fragariaefolia]
MIFGFIIRRHFNCDDVNFPKRTMSLGEYKNARGSTVFARNELQALFDADSVADMEDGEEDEEASSSRCDDPSVGSRCPCRDDSDASISKRSRSGSDRPLGDAGPLSCPRSGCDSTPSGTETLCATRGCRLQGRSNLASAVPLRRVSMQGTRAAASKTMMSLRSSTLIRRQIKDAITTSGSSISSDGTGTRRGPVEEECPSGRHSVKAGVLSLTTSTATQLTTRSAFA